LAPPALGDIVRNQHGPVILTGNRHDLKLAATDAKRYGV